MNSSRIIVIIIILAAIGGSYYYFQIYNIAPTPAGSNQTVIDLDNRLNEIRPLASVILDTSLFNNPFFRLLQPRIATTSAPISSPGRLNPFASY